MKSRLVEWLHGNWDIALMMLLVTMTNTHLVGIGEGTGQWAYAPGALAAGQWSRLFLHPFSHVTVYHLALDAGAFFLLYPLVGAHPRRRLFVFAVCLLGSMGLAAFDPGIASLGFCGLSGIGHGLVAAVALGMVRRARELQQSPWVGWGLLAGVSVKAVFEATCGSVFLSALHFGNVGTPNTYSHLGGIIGGVAGTLCLSLSYGFNRAAPIPSPARAA